MPKNGKQTKTAIIHITTGFTEVFSRLGKSEEGGNALALF